MTRFIRRNAIALAAHIITLALGIFFGAGLTVASLVLEQMQ